MFGCDFADEALEEHVAKGIFALDHEAEVANPADLLNSLDTAYDCDGDYIAMKYFANADAFFVDYDVADYDSTDLMPD